MFCPHCGASVKDGDAFCSSCGKALSSVSGGNASASGAASAGNASPKKSIGDIPTIWVVVAIVAIAAALYFLWPGGDDASDADSGSVQTPTTVQQPAASSQPATASSEPKSPLTMFVSQVDNSAYPQVTLYTKIADQAGSTPSGLDASQFTVTETDSSGSQYAATVEQVVPLAVGDAMNINLVVDQSGSMRARSKMDSAKKAASSFVDEMVKTQGNVAEITSFNDYVYNRQPFTSSAALLNSAIDAVSPTGETALYDALYWALQRTNLKSGSRVVIAFTDGEENSSNCSLNDVITLSQQTGIPVYIVGVGGDVNRSSLQSLASSCNGAYYDAASDDLAQALRQIYQSIYDDQRSMCRVVFTSTCPGSTSATRTVLLSCSDLGPFAGQISHTYVPVTSISSYDTSVSSQDYVLPGSASKYYSRSELEKMSLWELYLARNEIFARHGRGFKNQDLTDYFATKRWYTQTYTPEEFDAISSSQLNDYELKNVQTMYEIEQSRNSPYLETAE